MKKRKSTFEARKMILKEEEIIDLGPREEGDSVPVLYSPGWGETFKSSKEFLMLLSKKRRVVSLNQPRQLRIRKGRNGFSVVQNQRASCLLEILERKGLQKVDAIGYSEGGSVLSVASNFEPEKFRNVVLVSSSGLNGRDNFLNMFRRLIISNNIRNHQILAKTPEFREKSKNVGEDFNGYILKNIFLSLREANAMNRTEVYGILKDLKERGIGLAFVFGKDDPIYDAKKIREKVRELDLGEFYVTEGGHTHMKYCDNFRKLVIEALDGLG